MLDEATYQILARRLEDGSSSAATLFDELTQLPDHRLDRFSEEMRRADEIDVRIFFYRTLYRFHAPHPEVREEYLKLLRRRRPDWRRSPRTALIGCADLIDVGDYDAAFRSLRSFMWLRRRSWRISALFQILRIGQYSEAYYARCLPYARSLRTILEAELTRGRNEDRITKYAVCSLFITRGFVREFTNDTDSPLIRDAAARLEHTISELLADERNWDAC
jgi:uncharacterized protein (DUF2236 family)